MFRDPSVTLSFEFRVLKLLNTMKKLFYVSIVVMLALSSCKTDEEMTKAEANFIVTVENVSAAKTFFATGVFNTPVGETDPGPATPGKAYEFMFNAGKGHYLSFSTMFVQSNDLFFAPADTGIKLYDDTGMPITGDITDQIVLWDAGTEVNQEPGVGMDQPPRQSAPNTGADENGVIVMISDVMDGYTYPAVNETIKVMLSNNGGTMFTLSIENISAGAVVETPLAPGVWLIHDGAGKLFMAGAMASMGMERIAEDGDPAMMNTNLAANSGYVSPFAPGVFLTSANGSMPLFIEGSADFGDGLESLAEDGDPGSLMAALGSNAEVSTSGVFNTPSGSTSPGPLMPGQSYTFSFTAIDGENLNFATMLVQSNDLYFGFADQGIDLFINGTPVSGDMTTNVSLWDAGTEVNEYPGAGNNQPLRQGGANTGADENGNVIVVSDGFTYPLVNSMIKVTITSN
jgi:hypothetical protein